MRTSNEPPGLPANRVEALSDGVFAIAMTVLVLGLAVPEIAGGPNPEALLERLGALWPKLAAFAMSFVLIGTLWIGHHFQFHYIRRTNRMLLWLNILFLMLVSFLPFCTAVLGAYYEARPAVVLYGTTLFAAGVVLLLHWLYATHDHRLVGRDLDQRIIASVRNRIYGGLFVYGVAIGVGFVSTRASLAIFLGMPLLYLIPSTVDRHVGGRTDEA